MIEDISILIQLIGGGVTVIAIAVGIYTLITAKTNKERIKILKTALVGAIEIVGQALSNSDKRKLLVKLLFRRIPILGKIPIEKVIEVLGLMEFAYKNVVKPLIKTGTLEEKLVAETESLPEVELDKISEELDKMLTEEKEKENLKRVVENLPQELKNNPKLKGVFE